MRRYSYIFLLLIISTIALGQRSSNQNIKNLKVDQKSKLINDVTIGSLSFDGSAILTVTSTIKGALMPRMTTGQRDAIGSPSTGLLIYNTTTNQFEFFETIWQAIGGAGNTIYTADDALTGNRIVSQDANTLSFVATVVNAFSVDGTTFSVDASNNRVGISTAAPTTKFHVKGGSTTLEGVNAASTSDALFVTDNTGVTPLLIVKNDGKVGIGTSTPTNQLTLQGDNYTISVRNNAGQGQAFLESSTVDGGRLLLFSSGTQTCNIGATSLTGDFIKTGLNFGLGTSAPLQKLHIETNNPVIRLSDANATTDAEVTGNIQWHRGHSGNEVGFIGYASTGNEDLSIFNQTTNGSVDFFTNGTVRVTIDNVGNLGIADATPAEKLQVNGNAIIDSSLATTARITTLGVAATTFPVFSNVMTMTGDGGGNTVATITGANSGMLLTLIFVDANIIITDDNSHATNSVDLSAAFTGADDTTLQIVFDGTSWYELSRSTN